MEVIKKTMKQNEKPISTGAPALDALLGGGLRRGELSCLADSVRKDSTELLCDIAAAFTEQTDENVLLVCLSGTEEEGRRQKEKTVRRLAERTGLTQETLARRFLIDCDSDCYTPAALRDVLISDDSIGLVLIDRFDRMYGDCKGDIRKRRECPGCIRNETEFRFLLPSCVPYTLKKLARMFAVPILTVQRVPDTGTCSFYELGISPEFDHVAFLRETGGSLAFLPPQGNPLHMSGALMAAYHVWRSSDTLAEKHAAWREIIEKVPDEAIPFANWKAPRESLHAFLRDYMALENRLLDEFYDADGLIAYNYYDPNFELLVDNRGIFYDLNACLTAALSALEDSAGYEVWLYRIDLKNGRRTRALFDARSVPLDVNPEYGLFITEEEILWDSFVTLNRRFEDETELLSLEDDARFLPEEYLQF